MPMTVAVVPGIRLVQQMAVDAMRLGALQSPFEVDLSADRLQVSWIATGADTTQMVEIEALGNRSNQQFVSDAVAAYQPAIAHDVAIAVHAPSARPQPACFGLVDLRPEASFDRDRAHRHALIISRWQDG